MQLFRSAAVACIVLAAAALSGCGQTPSHRAARRTTSADASGAGAPSPETSATSLPPAATDVVIASCPTAEAVRPALDVSVYVVLHHGPQPFCEYKPWHGASVAHTPLFLAIDAYKPGEHPLAERRADAEKYVGVQHNVDGSVDVATVEDTPQFGPDTFRVVISGKYPHLRGESCDDYVLGPQHETVKVSASTHVGQGSPYKGSVSQATVCGWVDRLVELGATTG